MKNKIMTYLKELIEILKKPEMSILPANIAFYFILGLIPLFTITVIIASSFSISIDLIIDLVKMLFPSTIANTIISLISNHEVDASISLFNVLAFIVAANGTYAIVISSNTLYKVKKNDIVKDRLKALIILIIIVVLLLFLIIVPILGEQILSLFKYTKFNNIVPTLLGLYKLLIWPISFLIIYTNLKLVYTIAPSKQGGRANINDGAFFTTVCWVLVTAGFSYYVKNFASYDIVYGNLSTLVILMIWIYVLSFIFVLGMAINAMKYQKK